MITLQKTSEACLSKLTIDWTKILRSYVLSTDGVKNGFSPDYRFVLQSLHSFSERDIKPADKVFDKKKITNKCKCCNVLWVKQS